ncbi:MAG: S24 family peptidase [Alphaproteobacteria bacterium]|nr:S24 family peptidase [Alphaproteobacteria bacterium]
MYTKQAFGLNDNHQGLGQRLRLEMKKRGISSVELAKRADVKTSFLYDVISGKSANPSSIKLARVAESLGVSLTYLAGTSDSPVAGYEFSLPSQTQDYVPVSRLFTEGGALVANEDPMENCHFRKDWIRRKLCVSPADLRILTISGDGMAPTLCNGDIVLVDTSKKHPSPPGIFILFDGVGLAAKRLELLAQADWPKLRVIYDNPHYSTYEAPLAEHNIVGRVVWFSREI